MVLMPVGSSYVNIDCSYLLSCK